MKKSLAKQQNIDGQPFVTVYYTLSPSYPPEKFWVFSRRRRNEIKKCKNEKVKAEKYYAWKLLEYALSSSLGACVRKIKFYLGDNGKWKCRDYQFSISHSNRVVAVAISNQPVGVDVEKVTLPKTERILDKVLSNEELNEYNLASERKKSYIFTRFWTKKESIFKMMDKKSFLLENPKTFDMPVETKHLSQNGEDFMLSICAKDLSHLKIIEVDGEKWFKN